jgi:hypothetical protein
MAVPRTPVSELFEEHLRYAIRMLHGTLLRAGKCKDDAMTNNALMDAFCTYARALIEFLEKHGERYAKGYTAFDSITTARLKKINQRLNGQVAHLIYDGRVAEESAKISGQERFDIYEILRAEVESFNKCADAQHKLPDLPPVSIKAIDTASATSQIQMLGPWRVGQKIE